MGTTTSRGYRKPASTDNFSNLHVDIGNVADDVNTDMDATWGAAWTDFSASFTITATTNPTKGAGTVYAARYRLINAHTVRDVVRISIGSGWSAGTGVYFFSPSHTPADSEAYGFLGNCFLSQGGTEYVGHSRMTTNKVVLYVPKQGASSGLPVAAGQVTNLYPFVPASGAVIEYFVDYEI